MDSSWGTSALTSRRKILAALAHAERLRLRAIRALATLPLATSELGFAFSAELERLLQSRRGRLHRSHGYRGHAIGWKYSDGVARADKAITVFVRKKLSTRQLSRANRIKVPRWLRGHSGTKIGTDVVEFKVARKQRVTPGASIGPLHRHNPGTLACFAWDAHGNFVGLAAGHVAQGASRYVTPSGGALEFGVLNNVSLSPVDAATITVSSDWSQVMPNGSHLVGVRALTEHDVGAKVYVYGAQTGRWSPGLIEYLAPWISGWNLADAIVYSSATAPGDSGGPVIDQQGFLVGIHVGRGTYNHHDVAIAGSIARVARHLRVTPAF
jgi:hypothetical protein